MALAVAGCATPEVVKVVPVPDGIKTADNESLARIVPANGVQIYECRDSKWVFVAPEAQLFDAGGRLIGRHYAGPIWESADGSKVVGAVKSRADAPAAGAIPWLLLSTKSVGGEGAFSKVTSIQRVSTTGGVAPTGGCTQAGTQTGVYYSADYYFFIAR